MNLTPATVKKLATADGLSTAPYGVAVGTGFEVDLDSVQRMSCPTNEPGRLIDRSMIFVTKSTTGSPNTWIVMELLDIPTLDGQA